MEHNSRLVGNASAFGALALGGLLLVGCTALWNPLQRGGLDTDVRQLLRGAGVKPAQLDCLMLGDTRDGECSLSLTPSDAGALIRGLKLEVIPAGPTWASSLSQLVRFKGPGCAAARFSPSERHGIAGRPASLRLLGGSAFEYVLFSNDPRRQRACLQVSHTYG